MEGAQRPALRTRLLLAARFEERARRPEPEGRSGTQHGAWPCARLSKNLSFTTFVVVLTTPNGAKWRCKSNKREAWREESGPWLQAFSVLSGE